MALVEHIPEEELKEAPKRKKKRSRKAKKHRRKKSEVFLAEIVEELPNESGSEAAPVESEGSEEADSDE